MHQNVKRTLFRSLNVLFCAVLAAEFGDGVASCIHRILT